jgi:hypothetical protein
VGSLVAVYFVALMQCSISCKYFYYAIYMCSLCVNSMADDFERFNVFTSGGSDHKTFLGLHMS